MAIQFNLNALSAFSNVNFGDDDAIANLGGENGNIVKKNTYYGRVGKIFRLDAAKAANNAVRTELLKALGQAFNLQGVSEQDGKTTFTGAFMDRLSELLGPAFKRGDFGIDANGEVKSGKPLTQRRIAAICREALAKAETPYDGKVCKAKIDSFAASINGKMTQFTSFVAAKEYLATIRKTIAFLESDLDGFSEACKDSSLEEIKDFVFTRTRMTIFPDDIEKALDKEGAGDNGIGRIERIKNYIKERLQTAVKTSVDLCLGADDAKKSMEIVDATYRSYYRVESMLLALQEFTQPQLDR